MSVGHPRRTRPPARTARRVFLATLLAFALTAGPALAATSTVSFTKVQLDFMCTACHEPLNVARSPEAYDENTELRRLIRAGNTEPQIKREMVAQYGEGVLADPPAHGFNLLLFIIPGAVILGGLLMLAYTIPRWRRRSEHPGAEANTATADAPQISDEDAERLDADLARQT